MTKKKILVAQILFCSFLLGLAGLKRGEAVEKKLTYVKFATPSDISVLSLPFTMGKKRGLYKTEGLEVEIFLAMKSPLIAAGLIGGQIDYTGSGGETVFSAALGLPLKVLLVIGESLSHTLVSSPDIKRVEDLKGKVIVVGAFGSTAYFAAKDLLRHFGLDADKDVTIMGVAGDQKLSALLAGQAQASLLPPHDYMMAKKRGYKILAKVSDFVKTIAISLGTTDKKIKEKPKEVKGIVRATLKSFLYIKANKKEAIDFEVKEWGLNRDVVEADYELAGATYTKDGSVSEKIVLDTIDTGRKRGMKIKENIPSSQVVDFSFIREVHKELGLTP